MVVLKIVVGKGLTQEMNLDGLLVNLGGPLVQGDLDGLLVQGNLAENI